MTVSNSEYRALSNLLEGSVTLPDDARYDELRKPWLQIIDQHPALIVEAGSVADVVSAVDFARAHGLVLGIMSTGHGIAAPCDGGLLLRFTKFKGISIDASRKSASVGPGVLSGELLKAAHEHGLAYPAGQVSNVGVIGYTLGGGIGWLVRKLGAAADGMLGATVVLADGSVVRANAAENADLFWALRGGGGNFGIVVSLEIELSSIDEVVGGEIYYPLERAAEVIRSYRTWSAALTDDTSTILRLVAIPPDESAPPEIRGKTVCMIGVCHADPETADGALAALETFGEPLLNGVKRCSPGDMAELDPASHVPGAPAYGGVEYLKELSDDVIDGLVRLAHTLIPPIMQLEIQQLGGALRSVNARSGAFTASEAAYLLHLESPAAHVPLAEVAKATRDAFAALGDAYTGEKYFNFLRGDEQSRVASAFGAEKFARLRDLKRRYDPDNRFALNLNVEPA